MRDAYGSIAKAPNLPNDVKHAVLNRLRKSDLAQNYLQDSDAQTFSEYFFRLLLKYSFLNFLI